MANFKSLFRYCGGKSKQTDLLKGFFPDAFTSYRECFIGGGSLFFSIEPLKPCWINDANAGLMAVYRALRDRPDDFIHACRSIPPAAKNEPAILSSKGTAYNRRLHDLFHQFTGDEQMDLALRYFFLNRCGFNGRVLLSAEKRNRMYFSNPTGWNIVKGNALEQAAARLKQTTITAGDYTALLTEPGDDVLVYADPPYWKDTVLPKSAKLYEIGFTEMDHVRFRDAALASPHRVIVSYDDCEFIRNLWEGFYIHEASWHYSGTVSGRRQGRELIITNYPIQAAALRGAA